MNKRQKKKLISRYPWVRTRSGKKISSIKLQKPDCHFYPLRVKFEGLITTYTYTKDGYYVNKRNPCPMDLVL